MQKLQRRKRKYFQGKSKNISAKNKLYTYQLYSSFIQGKFTQQHHINNSSYTNLGWRSNSMSFSDKYYKNCSRTPWGCRKWFIHCGKEEKVAKCPLPCQIQARNKSGYPFPFFLIIFATAGFKIIDSLIFQEIMFPLRCSFYNNGPITSYTS